MASILQIPFKVFPTQDAQLNFVYNRYFPARGYASTWVAPSAQVSEPTIGEWNGSRSILVPYRPGKGLIGAVLGRLAWVRLCRTVWTLLKQGSFDVVQTRNATLGALVALAAARRFGARYVYQFTFPVPEALIEAAREGRTRMPFLQIRIGRIQIFLRNWMMKKADLVLAISPEMRRQLIQLGLAPERVFVFPMGTEGPNPPSEDERASLRNTLGIGDCPVLIYFGVISIERKMDFVVRVLAKVCEAHPSTRLVMVGPAFHGEEIRLHSLAKQLGVGQNLMIVPRVARDEVPLYISIADLSLSPIPPTPLFWLSWPTKAVESLGVGCPVVCSPIPSQAELVSSSGGGVVAQYDEQEFSDAICKLLSDKDYLKAAGRSGRAYVREHYSYERISRDLADKYEQILH